MTTLRTRLSACVSLVVLSLVSSTAFAQQADSAASAPAPVAPVSAAAPSEAAPPQKDKVETTKSPDEEDHGRFRFGISAFGGPLFMAGNSGGAGGIDLRFGAQVNNLLGIYAQPILIAGGGASSGSSGGSASGLAMGGAGLLAEFAFLDMLYVGAGPELLAGAAGSASAGTSGTGAKADTGTFFSVAARAGLALGSVKPARRKAFTIGLDLHAVFATDTVVTPMLALGYDAF